MKLGICFLMGHKDTPSEIFPILTDSIEKHITQYGVKEFFFGNHGNFDSMAVRALTLLKHRYPHIRRILIEPYHPALTGKMSIEAADELFYPFEKPVIPQYAVLKANDKMIDLCDDMIVYVGHTGKSKDCFEYAKRRSKKKRLNIDHLADRIKETP